MLERSPDLSDLDLNGFLFVNYEDWLSLDDSLERLECEILELWDKDRESDIAASVTTAPESQQALDEPDDDADLPSLDRYWLFRVERSRAEKSYRASVASLSPTEVAAYEQMCLRAINDYREKNRAAIAARTLPPFPPSLPEIPCSTPSRRRLGTKTTKTPKGEKKP